MEVRESLEKNSCGRRGGKFCIFVNIVSKGETNIVRNGYCYTNAWAANCQNLAVLESILVPFVPFTQVINRNKRLLLWLLLLYLPLYSQIVNRHNCSPNAQQPLVGKGPSGYKASRSHSVIHTTLDRTPLDEWSARHRYLTTHSNLKRQTSMSPAWFEPKIPASEWPQTHAVDGVSTEIGQETSHLYQLVHYSTTSQ
jgi:hypothetical protein